MGKSNSRATVDQLLKSKKPHEKEVSVTITGDDGEEQEVTVLFRSIGGQEYDDLVSKNPPTRAQEKDGLTFNIDKFAPKLISACAVEPEISEEQAREIWVSPSWNRGERMALFMGAAEVCTKGMNVPFGDIV